MYIKQAPKPNLLLRLQAQFTKKDTILEQENLIQKTALQLPKPKNTTVTKKYVKRRSHSWQAHLTRISPYLNSGPGVWWKESTHGFEFADGPDEPESRSEGPRMPHFRNSTLEALQEQKRVQFNKLLESKVSIPAEIVRIFDGDGVCTEVRKLNRTYEEDQEDVNMPTVTSSTETADSIHTYLTSIENPSVENDTGALELLNEEEMANSQSIDSATYQETNKQTIGSGLDKLDPLVQGPPKRPKVNSYMFK